MNFSETHQPCDLKLQPLYEAAASASLSQPLTSLTRHHLFVAGIMSTDAVGREYLKETNMMFIGGLMVAIGVEHSNLHRRIALKVSLSLHPSFELDLS